MIIETERLMLRPWELDDAEELYEYARDPDVGPIAGWPPHTSIENSREIIRDVLSAPETYAVTLRKTGQLVGCIGLMCGSASDKGIPDDEGEIGYWMGKPHWGQGFMPEATRALMQHAFADLGFTRLWCGYFDGNERSRRVQEKCGFAYHHTRENVPCQIAGLVRTEHVSCITREAWEVGEHRGGSTHSHSGTTTIRSACVGDAERLLKIYAHYVKHTAVSFEYDVPTLEEFRGRIAQTLEHYPYLVLEDGGTIWGYAYAGPFAERAAYRRSCELSIYLDHTARRKGYGRALYEELEAQLKEAGMLNLYACIADPIEEDEYLTRDSERFHERLGFEKVGTFHLCGYKFGRWYHMIWMEKLIGAHE